MVWVDALVKSVLVKHPRYMRKSGGGGRLFKKTYLVTRKSMVPLYCTYHVASSVKPPSKNLLVAANKILTD